MDYTQYTHKKKCFLNRQKVNCWIELNKLDFFLYYSYN